MDTRLLAAALDDALEAELPAAVELRHLLHAAPELSGEEHATAAAVGSFVGVESATVAGTGRLIRTGPAARPAVAVRGELDALPVTERTGSPHAAGDGVMHACGHDVHLAAAAALARAAQNVETPLGILTILQPREEGPPSGARDIVEAAVLGDVHAVVGAHVQPLLPRGTVAAASGAVNAASDQFEIVIHGRGGHGGYPHLTRDPVVTLAQVIVALQQVVSRRVDPLHSAVLTIGSVQAGSAANVVPDEARARGTVRVLDEDDREPVHRELRTVVDRVAAAFDCRGEVVVHDGEPALVNDAVLAVASHPWLDLLGFDLTTSLRSCGADDFAHYRAVAPSLMMFVGVEQAASLGDPPGLHHPAFYPTDEAVGDVARALLAGYLAAVEGMVRP